MRDIVGRARFTLPPSGGSVARLTGSEEVGPSLTSAPGLRAQRELLDLERDFPDRLLEALEPGHELSDRGRRPARRENRTLVGPYCRIDAVAQRFVHGLHPHLRIYGSFATLKSYPEALGAFKLFALFETA
jgi:hypothetical protein